MSIIEPWRCEMSAESNERKVRIFVAAPADVATERAKVHTVVDSLSSLAEQIGVALEVLDWHQVVPDIGRPQQVIFEQLQPTEWDIFIGILWQHFGTPQGEYVSGAEEEFQAAYRLWQQFNRPRLMAYR